ncbi:MAG: sigma-70 family RNA polymerase sigma factor [Clostridia bacterium]|nr:sigma-70 family RNA polymerase sigma factor [Clostridia bacterium]MBQ4338206.1 sigma-70 family RNA polymerase sigma factor [Clostridia bacterium]
MENAQIAVLATRIKEGDAKAFEEVHITFSPEVYSVAYGITNDRDEAQDLTQDSFVCVLENIETLKEPEKFKKWLMSITANKSKDYLKKKKPAILTDEQNFIIENLEENEISVLPERAVDTEERAQEMRDIIESISEDKRLCLILRYKYEMSYAEIAQTLEISEGAVKSRIFRAKEDVEQAVEKRRRKGLPLFALPPLALAVRAVVNSAEVSASAFAGSAAQSAALAGITAAAQAGTAAVVSSTAGAAAATSAGASASVATTAGVGAKIAAMTVVQKVVSGVALAGIVTGSAVGTTVAVKNKVNTESVETTSSVEQSATVPDYRLDNVDFEVTQEEGESSSLPSLDLDLFSSSATEKKSENTVSSKPSEEKTTSVTSSTVKQTEPVTEKSTTVKTTVQSTTKKKETTTTEKQTTQTETTTESTTEYKAITAPKADTEKETETKEQETQSTTKEPETTTQEQTTTQASLPATVSVTVWSSDGTNEVKTLEFDAGDSITANEIENRLASEYQIEALAEDIDVIAESGGSYTATAYA